MALQRLWSISLLSYTLSLFKTCLIICICISNGDFGFKMGLKPEM